MTVTDLEAVRREKALETLARLRTLAAAAATEDEAREVANRIRAFVRKVRASRWEPYVWQHPHVHPEGWVSARNGKPDPDGVCDAGCSALPPAVIPTHGAWLPLGGRGTGKTEGNAHYVNRHVEGPPCDPRVPGGHRLTIVAPTQADAVSSCVTGVSGLQAINPGITLATSREGTLARWPNGAVARVLGAHGPLDVERLRAWTNVCVAEGSLIQTDRGPVPIEQVRPGVRVWTRTGLRAVVRAEATGVRPVVRVTADGGDVWVTPDHPVARPGGGFSRADAGGNVLVWLEQPWSTTASPGPNEMTGTPGPRSGTPRHEHGSSACASCVAAGSPALAGTRPEPVARPAAVSPPTRLATVYDLAVDGHHEFYAGGVLVGNCLVWVEEAAAQRQLAGVLDQAPFTLRLGHRPHLVVSTTPKNRPEVIDLLADPKTVRTKGRTRDAYRLDPGVREVLETKFGGTTMGRQELDAEVLEDVEGALWVTNRPDLVDGAPNPDDRPGLDNHRVPDGYVGWEPHSDSPYIAALAPPENPTLMLDRIVIGVDPPGGQTEAGIVAHGVAHGHGYTVADLSLAGSPDTWGTRAVQAYMDLGAEGIVLEKAYGGDMTDHVITNAAEALGVPAPPIFRAPTKVGKRLRAEPVVGLSQQGKIHHVGRFPLLEAEQTGWVEDETPESPNRLDAYVHAVTHLQVRSKQGKASKPTGRRVRSTSSTWAGGSRRA